MSSADLLKEAQQLSVVERLELIDLLIESVELDRRYRTFLANPNEGEPWEVVREKIRQR